MAAGGGGMYGGPGGYSGYANYNPYYAAYYARKLASWLHTLLRGVRPAVCLRGDGLSSSHHLMHSGDTMQYTYSGHFS